MHHYHILFWYFAFAAATITYNRTTTVVLNGKRPYVKLYGSSLNNRDLRTFGSLVFPNLKPSDEEWNILSVLAVMRAVVFSYRRFWDPRHAHYVKSLEEEIDDLRVNSTICSVNVTLEGCGADTFDVLKRFPFIRHWKAPSAVEIVPRS